MMYLVTPAIYEKLLKCIDEGDKKLLDSLNKPPEISQDRRPAQVIIDSLSHQEIRPINVPIDIDRPIAPAAVHKVDPVSLPPINVQTPHVDPIITNQPVVAVDPININQPNIPIVSVDPSNINPPVIPVSQPVPVTIDPNPFQALQQPVITSVPQPNIGQTQINVPSNIPVPTQVSNIKPVTLNVPSTIVQPAGFSQPIQPMDIGDDSEWEDVTEMDYETRGKKRRQSEIEESDKKRALIQWQPLQCVTNTTGGQICNPDPIQPTTLIRQPSTARRGPIRVRGDLYNKPIHCHICDVRLGNEELLNMHLRLKHGVRPSRRLKKEILTMSDSESEHDPETEIRDVRKKIPRKRFTTPGIDPSVQLTQYDPSQDISFRKTKKKSPRKRFTTPGFDTSLQDTKYDPSQDVSFRKTAGKIKRRRFTSRGRQTPIQPFVYNPSQDVSFRKSQVKSTRRKRFQSSGRQTPIQPLVIDPSQDVSFRKKEDQSSAPKPRTLRRLRPNKYRCPRCNVTLGNLSLLKDHIRLKHNEDPNDVIAELSATMLTNPRPGGSRDFSDWSSLRLQPRRVSAKQKGKGKHSLPSLKNKTQNFKTW